MEIQCQSCLTKYKVTRPNFEGKKQVKIRCKKCQKPIIITNPDYDDEFDDEFDGFNDFDPPQKSQESQNNLKNRIKQKKNRSEEPKKKPKERKKMSAALKKQQEEMAEWDNKFSYRNIDQVRAERAEKAKLERFYKNYIPEHFLLPHNRIDIGSLVLRLMLIISFLPIVAMFYYGDIDHAIEVLKMTYLMAEGSVIHESLQLQEIYLKTPFFSPLYSFMFAKLIAFLSLILILIQSAKRCHDIGISGRFFWMILIPGLNLIFFIKGSQKEDNRFGGYKK